MFSKLTLFFLIVFVTALECQNVDDVPSFIKSGEEKIAAKEKEYSDFASDGSYNEQKLRTLMLQQIEWRNETEIYRNQLQDKLTNTPGLTDDEKTKLQNDINLLQTAYVKVFLADHLNIHVVFDHVQAALLHVLDALKSNDIDVIKNTFNSVVASLIAVTEDIKVQGGKSLVDIAAYIAGLKQAKNQPLDQYWKAIEQAQYSHINDDILHMISELCLEKANIQNQIRIAQRLIKTQTDPKVIAAIQDLINRLSALSNDIDEFVPKLVKRLRTDL